MTLDDEDVRPRFLIRDRDSKFTRTRDFDEVFRSQVMRVIKAPVRASKARPHACAGSAAFAANASTGSSSLAAATSSTSSPRMSRITTSTGRTAHSHNGHRSARRRGATNKHRRGDRRPSRPPSRPPRRADPRIRAPHSAPSRSSVRLVSYTRGSAKETDTRKERSELPQDATRTSHTDVDTAPRSATVRI
jgi:hypothetical protein